MLEIRELSKTYKPKRGVPVTALDRVSIKFADKGMVFLLGKSGSGKSTMLNVLGGLDRYDSGEMLIKGVSSKDFSQSHFDSYRNTYVGFIFQEYNILDEFTVGANIALAIELQGRKATDAEINDILDKVDLTGYGNRRPNELSGGQKQRVAIAGVIAMMPECIVFDESTAMLDPRGRAEVMQTIARLNRECGMTVLHITHYMDEAVKADRVMVINDGELFADGTPKDVFRDVAALRRVGLDVPQGRELLYTLARHGVSFADTPIDNEGCAALILERFQNRVQ